MSHRVIVAAQRWLAVIRPVSYGAVTARGRLERGGCAIAVAAAPSDAVDVNRGIAARHLVRTSDDRGRSWPLHSHQMVSRRNYWTMQAVALLMATG